MYSFASIENQFFLVLKNFSQSEIIYKNTVFDWLNRFSPATLKIFREKFNFL
jgi:hypothetical protein